MKKCHSLQFIWSLEHKKKPETVSQAVQMALNVAYYDAFVDRAKYMRDVEDSSKGKGRLHSARFADPFRFIGQRRGSEFARRRVLLAALTVLLCPLTLGTFLLSFLNNFVKYMAVRDGVFKSIAKALHVLIASIRTLWWAVAEPFCKILIYARDKTAYHAQKQHYLKAGAYAVGTLLSSALTWLVGFALAGVGFVAGLLKGAATLHAVLATPLPYVAAVAATAHTRETVSTLRRRQEAKQAKLAMILCEKTEKTKRTGPDSYDPKLVQEYC